MNYQQIRTINDTIYISHKDLMFKRYRIIKVDYDGKVYCEKNRVFTATDKEIQNLVKQAFQKVKCKNVRNNIVKAKKTSANKYYLVKDKNKSLKRGNRIIPQEYMTLHKVAFRMNRYKVIKVFFSISEIDIYLKSK